MRKHLRRTLLSLALAVSVGLFAATDSWAPYGSLSFPTAFDSAVPNGATESIRLGAQRMDEIKWFMANVLGIPDGETLNGPQHFLTHFSDFFQDFIISGFLGTAPASSPIMTTPTGTGYVNGRRIVGVTAGYTYSYAINSDTYDDINQYASLIHTAVANGAAAPAVTANSLRVQLVVTGPSRISSVTDLRKTWLAWVASRPFTMSGTLTAAAATFASVPSGSVVVTDANSNLNGRQLTNGQLIIGATGAWPSVGTLTAGTGITITNASGSITITNANTAPRNYLTGLTLSNDAASTSTTLAVASGVARDSVNAYDLAIASSVSKILQAGGAWASGSNANGLFGGVRASGTVYHVCAIRADSDGAIDFGFDASSAICANRPAGYSNWRRIGSVLTDATNAIRQFRQDGDYFRYNSPILDVDTTAQGTTTVVRALRVPTGVKVLAKLNVLVGEATAGVYLYDPDITTTPPLPNTASAPLFSVFNNTVGAGNFDVGQVEVWTNAASGAVMSIGNATLTLRMVTYGWVDRRGRDAQ